MRRRAILVTTALAVAFGPAARAELVLSVYTGTSWTHSSDLRIDQPASRSNAEFHGVQWEPKPFHAAPYYGVRLSYFPNRSARLGGNIDFTHYKMYAETDRVTPVRGTWNGAAIDAAVPINALVQSLEVSHGVNLTSLNVEYRWPSDAESVFLQRWSPHVGAGITMYLPHAEGSINGLSVAGNYQRAGEGYQLFAGAEYPLLARLGVFVDAKLDEGQLDIDLAPATRIQTRTRTLHAVAGLAWHF